MQQPPLPVSYGSAAYWAIHAFIWVNAVLTFRADAYAESFRRRSEHR
ncbi:hypothetical protein [Nonomuraea jiangxiensis]|uniref:Uncharacterized protein n=1 Tax=Nonomuraea jiangxiensis TaxID=633440 RepID=A0A1G9N1U1_9ACTN|nr:hypothetical protein [Nonomuraea jiangxiensis]SDL80231.1 hypothetical protein SAMN05421869_1317 [Nonomuraea jiangxiensis]